LPIAEHPLHGVELYTIIAFIVWLIRAAYNFITGDFVFGLVDKLRKRKKVAADKPPPGMLSSPFKLRINRTWRAAAFLLVIAPFGGMCVLSVYYLQDQMFLLTKTYQAFQGSSKVNSNLTQGVNVGVDVQIELAAIFLMAAFLDGKDVLWVSGLVHELVSFRCWRHI